MYFSAENHVPIPTKDLLSWIFDDVQSRFDPDEPIYIDAKNPSNSISSNQARSMIRKLVAGFHAAGLKKGDVVCLHAFNDINYSILFLAIIAAGGVYAGTNPSYTQFELVHHIKTAKTKFLITEPEMLPNILGAAKECSIPESRVWIFDVLGGPLPNGFKSWKTLMDHGEEDWVRFDDEKTCKETTAALLFSSGTTGLPKAAILSHHNFIAQHTLVREHEHDYKIIRLIALPGFHAAAVPVTHTTPLRSGHVSVIMRRFELDSFMSNIEQYSITDAAIVPPIAIAILMSENNKKYSFESIRYVSCGAAPLGKESQARLRKLLPQRALFNQVWGMTEMCCVGSMLPYPEDDETGSIGRPLPNCDFKIIDDNDQNITAYNTLGELCVRGPIVIKGYFENPLANTQSFDSEGFFKTGDIVYCNSKSKLWYIVDRKKELIKVRGFQVAPPELETVLLSHPYIVDAAVIGVKNLSGDEEPRAYVVRRKGNEGEGLGEKEVREWCGRRLAKFKELTGGVRFVDSIPKNASGKILKRVLREEAKAEIEGGKARL